MPTSLLPDDGFKRILVIHFGQLGDVVLGLPALQAIREAFGDAHLTVMTGKPAAEIVRMSKAADEVIPVDRVALRDGNKLRSIGRILRLVREVRSYRFDLVIDLHSLSETNLLGFLARIPRRLYANRENRSLDRLSNFRPRPPREDKSLHMSTRYMDVLRPLGINGPPIPFRFGTLDIDPGVDRERIDGSIGFFPGAGHPSRCWPIQRFAELAFRLAANGARIAVFLGPEESSLRPEITDLFPKETDIIEGLSLTQFSAALQYLRLFICNDTGPMHLAACAGVPVLLLMDERAPTTYLPLTDTLRVVRHGKLDEITVDEVFAAANAVLRGEYDKALSA